jgi:hypothetical protein
MPYVTVPKDVTKVKTKVLFNLTKRQLICFGGGLLIGVPLFFLTRNSLGNTMSTLLMIFSVVPAFLLAMYEKNGQHLEVILRNMIRSVFLRPKKRLYKTNNFYAVIERQNNLDKEVYSIVHKEKTVDRGKKGYTGRYLKSEKNG